MPPAPTGPPSLIDTHAHLADPRLASRIGAVLDGARAAGVVQVIAVATTAADGEAGLALARDHRGVFATVGIHPNDAAEAAPGDWDRVRSLAKLGGVVALGETGLDRHWDRTPFAIQRDYFGRHLEAAAGLDLPVIIHGRECHRDIVDQLAALGRPVRGVLHSFVGDEGEAAELVALGLHISFAGMVTFANKGLDPLRRAAASVPLDRLLVETDSPYLSPHPHRGKANEPSRVALTAAKVAEVRGISTEALAAATTANARRLFRLDPEDVIADPVSD